MQLRRAVDQLTTLIDIMLKVYNDALSETDALRKDVAARLNIDDSQLLPHMQKVYEKCMTRRHSVYLDKAYYVMGQTNNLPLAQAKNVSIFGTASSNVRRALRELDVAIARGEPTKTATSRALTGGLPAISAEQMDTISVRYYDTYESASADERARLAKEWAASKLVPKRVRDIVTRHQLAQGQPLSQGDINYLFS